MSAASTPGRLVQPGPTDQDADGSRIDAVALCDRDGVFDVAIRGSRIEAIRPSPDGTAASGLLMPAFVNAHAHANRAFAAGSRRPRSLQDAVAQAGQERSRLGESEFRARALRLFERAVAHGTARIRTHTDVDSTTGLQAISGVLAAAREMTGVLDVEVVAFAHAAADPARVQTQELLTEAVKLGAGLIGAVPALSAAPAESVDAVLDLATRLDVGVDFHLDEHLDPGRSLLGRVIDGTVARQLQGRVTISHGCALSVMREDEALRLLGGMARARMPLVVLPELNLYLQGRSDGSPGPRGIAPMKLARQAGVPLRLGTDNVRDWFFPFGDGDLLESAYVAALGAHFDTADALVPCICGGEAAIRAGDLADLVLLPATSLDEALATRPAGRVLYRRGLRVRAHPQAASGSID